MSVRTTANHQFNSQGATKKMTKLRQLSGVLSPAFLMVEREEGQTLAEYAMILALIAILVVTAVLFLSGQISSLFSQVASQI